MRLYWRALPPQQRILRDSSKASRRWNAYLAGGTALALQLGHRQSEDLDWFTPRSVSPDEILTDVENLGYPTSIVQNELGTFHAVVGGVKFSVLRYRYPMVDDFVSGEDFELASLADLSAMKLSALMGRSTVRDYVDVHEMLVGKQLTLQMMVQAFETKYSEAHVEQALLALASFKDVTGTMPIMP